MSQSLIRHLSVPLLILSCAALSGCGVEEEKAPNADTAGHQGHNSDTASPRDTAQDTEAAWHDERCVNDRHHVYYEERAGSNQ